VTAKLQLRISSEFLNYEGNFKEGARFVPENGLSVFLLVDFQGNLLVAFNGGFELSLLIILSVYCFEAQSEVTMAFEQSLWSNIIESLEHRRPGFFRSRSQVAECRFVDRYCLSVVSVYDNLRPRHRRIRTWSSPRSTCKHTTDPILAAHPHPCFGLCYGRHQQRSPMHYHSFAFCGWKTRSLDQHHTIQVYFCLLLVSAYHETHRLTNSHIGVRRVMTDTWISDGDYTYLLKAGADVQMPAEITHLSPKHLGPDCPSLLMPVPSIPEAWFQVWKRKSGVQEPEESLPSIWRR
jgi:hypothetical protein